MITFFVGLFKEASSREKELRERVFGLINQINLNDNERH